MIRKGRAIANGPGGDPERDPGHAIVARFPHVIEIGPAAIAARNIKLAAIGPSCRIFANGELGGGDLGPIGPVTTAPDIVVIGTRIARKNKKIAVVRHHLVHRAGCKGRRLRHSSPRYAGMAEDLIASPTCVATADPQLIVQHSDAKRKARQHARGRGAGCPIQAIIG